MLLKALAKDSVIYGGADLATKIVAFLTFPLIAAVLTPEAFGAMELIGTATTLLGLFVNCGLNNGVQRFYWDVDAKESDRPSIVTSGFVTLVLLTLVCLLLALVTLPWINGILKKQNLPITWISLVAGLFVMSFTQWTQYTLDVIRLHFAPWKYLGVSLSSRVLSQVAGLLTVVTLGWGVDGLLSAQALVMLIVVVLGLIAIRKDFRLSAFSRKWAEILTKFGYPFIFAGIGYWLFGVIDRWLLATLTTVEEVGIYSVAFRFAAIVVFVSGAFSQAWSPFAIKVRTDHPTTYREVYGQILVLLIFVMLAVGGGLALFSSELIGIMMPAKYAGSAAPLSVLCFGIVLQASQQVTAVGISLEKKTYIFARLTWISAIINTGISFLLIPKYGSMGAAWATSIAHLVLTVLYIYFTQKLHPLKIAWGQIAIVILFMAVFIFVSLTFTSTNLMNSVFYGKIIFFLIAMIIGYFLIVKPNLKLADVR